VTAGDDPPTSTCSSRSRLRFASLSPPPTYGSRNTESSPVLESGASRPECCDSAADSWACAAEACSLGSPASLEGEDIHVSAMHTTHSCNLGGGWGRNDSSMMEPSHLVKRVKRRHETSPPGVSSHTPNTRHLAPHRLSFSESLSSIGRPLERGQWPEVANSRSAAQLAIAQ
jgi:hypothetical protein